MKKVTIGIKNDSLYKIMGNPDTILTGNLFNYNANYKVYRYQNKFGTSDDINIVIDSTGIVKNIFSSN